MKIIFHPLFLFVVILSFFYGFAIYILLCLVAVLIHEFCHAITARHFGVSANRITILPFGAAVNIDCDILPRKNQVMILLAGSLGNIITALFAGGLLWIAPQLFIILGMFIVANTIIAIMNLIPLYPLDMGKIIELFATRRVIKFLHIITNLIFTTLFFVACFVTHSWSVALFAVCMMFTVNTEKRNDYTMGLAEIMDILYNEKYGSKNQKN